METLTIQTQSRKQAKLFEDLAKELKLVVTKKKAATTYDPAFVEKIKKSSAQAKKGEVVKIKVADLWK